MNTTQVLNFLKALHLNNNKEWMEANKRDYHQAKATFATLIEGLLQELQQFEPSLAGLAAKDCIFRINRDLRFTKDKSPYKNNFGASIAEGGKKSLNAGYYLHLQPHDESFIGGGLYMPPGDYLKKIRQEIDYNAGELLEIVTDKHFKESFGSIQGEKLARAPKGYTPDHPNIEFLKLKSYVVLQKLTDEEIQSPNLVTHLAYKCSVMKPFLDFLNIAVS